MFMIFIYTLEENFDAVHHALGLVVMLCPRFPR